MRNGTNLLRVRDYNQQLVLNLIRLGDIETRVNIKRVKNGWAALGDGWAVHGKTEEEAIKHYHEAVAKHREIRARSIVAATEAK
jgi:hypothetical protein